VFLADEQAGLTLQLSRRLGESPEESIDKGESVKRNAAETSYG
jgi:hypothetical protein